MVLYLEVAWEYSFTQLTTVNKYYSIHFMEMYLVILNSDVCITHNHMYSQLENGMLVLL